MQTPRKLVTLAALALAPLALAPLALADDGAKQTAPAPAPAAKAPEKPADKPAEKDQQKAEFAYVELTTSMGSILLELNQAKAPITCENFLKYVQDGHYAGTIFHRVIDGFMVQGGGFTKDMKEKSTRGGIKNEWKNGLINKKGTIAMARTPDPDSASAQFFINVKDNDFLSQPNDGAGYAVFGKVVQGMEVVEKIKGVKTGVDRTTGMEDVPTTPIEITAAKQLTADEAKSKLAESTTPAEKKPETK